MKKITAIILVLCLVLSLAGCSSTSSVGFTAVWGKSDVYEVSTYEISILQGETVYYENAPVVTGEGTLTQTISGNYSDGFVVENVLIFEGLYDFGSYSEEFTQDIYSKVIFADVTSNLTSLYSEKTYSGTTLAYDIVSDTFSVEELDYSVVTNYVDGDAVVVFESFDGGASASFAGESTYAYSGTIFDNEQLYTVVRALIKDDFDSTSFNSFNPFGGVVPVAVIMLEMEDEADSIVEKTINGETITFDTYSVQMQINETFTGGTATLMLFSVGDEGYVTTSAGNSAVVDRSRLLQVMIQVPYTSAIFNFELVGFETE